MKNIIYMMRFCGVLFTLSKKLPILSAAQIILASIQPMVSVILSAHIIQRLIDRAEPQQVILTAVVLVIFNLIAGIISAYLKSRVLILGDTVKDDFCLRIGQKIMKLPYERLEDPALQDLKQQALMPVIQWGNFEFVLNEAVPQIAGSILTIITTAAIVARNNLFLLIPISIIAVFCMFISAKRQRVFNEIMTRMGLIERKMAYFGQLAVDFSAGKEIRLFGMDRVIMDKIKQYSGSELYEFTRVLNSTTRFNILETILTQLQVYIIYGVVAFDVIDRGLPIGSFLEVTGLFANVGASVYMLLNTLAAVNVRGHFIGKYFEFHTLPESNVAKTCVSSVNAAQDIEINNVSFTYAHTGKPILRDITLSIPAGKKIALVGENGSGKTTLVKLICGLLTPTGGVIQIGGRAINGCCNESVSAVFQDFKLFAFSIRENIEMSSPGQADAISSLERVGLLEYIKKLDNGIKTALYKVYDNNGVELSGGQGQKLAISRAIYKDTGVILLDEPTAALDPKAEAEIFNNFQTITTGKTALLVSHRLSSCRFCDNIVVLADGQIIEQGTHDELMMITGGKYRQMFAAQAEYFSHDILQI